MDQWSGWMASLFRQSDHKSMRNLIQRLLADVILPHGVHDQNISEKVLESFVSSALRDKKTVCGKIEAVMSQFDVFELLLDGANAMLKMMSRGSEISGKFVGELVYGNDKDFFKGLTDRIGEPDFLDLYGAVQREHDSTEKFTTKNYNITTSPWDEWQLAFGGLHELSCGRVKDGPDLGMRQHKSPKDLLAQLPTLLKKCFQDDPNLKTFASNVTEEAVKAIGLLEEEVGCLRMYTGDLCAIPLSCQNFTFFQVQCFRSTTALLEVLITPANIGRQYI